MVRWALLLVPLVAAAACIPYTVGSTPQTAPADELQTAAMLYYLPAAVDLVDSTRGRVLVGMDLEMRFGIDDRSDVGLRLTSFSGGVLTYKRMLTNPEARTPAAFMVGGGVVNAGDHAHLEASLFMAGPEASRVTPYGGLRVMQVFPMVQGAVRDSPTAGGFLGVRLGNRELGVSPEISVFYDRSALGLRDRNVIVVFSVTVHGDRLRRMVSPL
jgi:hypothetical protein